MQTGQLSRRGFLAGAAAAGAAGALAGSAALADGAAGAQDAGERLYTPREASAHLNEQVPPADDGFRSNSGNLSAIFSELDLGPFTIKNRLCRSAAGITVGSTPEEEGEYYARIIEGGVPLIWMDPHKVLSLTTFADLDDGTPIAENELAAEVIRRVHEAGGRIGVQFIGAFGLSDINALTTDEVRALRDDYIQASAALKGMGFDGIEVHSGTQNNMQAFLARYSNHREDEYGPQSIESRARFTCEVISGMREACGDDFLIQVAMNGMEGNLPDLGDDFERTTVEEACAFAKLFEAAGADCLHIRISPLPAGANYSYVAQVAPDVMWAGYGIDGATSYGTQVDFTRHFEGLMDGAHSGCAWAIEVAAKIKQAVSIPVGVGQYMDVFHAPDTMERFIEEGKVDFFYMVRPIQADPEYVNKLQEGRFDEIAPCTRCIHCFMDYDDDGFYNYHCRVNATVGRAWIDAMPEGPDPVPAETPKKVMVVGAGPAGMEAARIAAQRGHDVTLYERNGFLGGLLTFAEAIKGEHENLGDLRSYLERQQEVCGVTVVTGTEVTADLVRSESPDAVILATGGLRDTLGLQGTEGTSVVPIDEIISAPIGDRVVIAGGSAQALDAALWLVAQGKQVSIVMSDPESKLGKGQSSGVREFVIPALHAKGVRVIAESSVSAVNDGSVTVAAGFGVDLELACDTLVEALDMLPNTQLADELSDLDVRRVGDCAEPFNIAEAIAAGNLAARAV